MKTIHSLLVDQEPGAPAIGAPDRTPMSFADLRDLSDRTVTALNRIGIGRGDRVAIVLPNGPEMAAAFIAVGAGASTAPLNPAYRADEFEFYLNDLNAKVSRDMDSLNKQNEQALRDLKGKYSEKDK